MNIRGSQGEKEGYFVIRKSCAIPILSSLGASPSIALGINVSTSPPGPLSAGGEGGLIKSLSHSPLTKGRG